MRKITRFLFSLFALLLVASFAQEQAYAAPFSDNYTFTTVGTYRALPRQVGTGINKHMLVCWIEGTANAATVKLQSSVDNVTFGTDVISLDCTTGGVSSSTTAAGNYFRYGLTAATALSAGAKVTVTYYGLAESIASSGSSGGTGSCSTSSGIVYFDGSAFNCGSGATTDGSGNVTLTGRSTSGSFAITSFTSGQLAVAGASGLMRGVSALTYNSAGNINSITLSGATSGSAIITVPAAAGSPTITLGKSSGTLPVITGNFSTDDCLKMNSSGIIVSAGAACSSSSGSLKTYDVTLTDADIKALPTTAFTLASPSAGKALAFTVVAAVAQKFSGGLYDNASSQSAATIKITQAGTAWTSALYQGSLEAILKPKLFFNNPASDADVLGGSFGVIAIANNNALLRADAEQPILLTATNLFTNGIDTASPGGASFTMSHDFGTVAASAGMSTGSGTGAVFGVTSNSMGTYQITVVTIGNNYAEDETITIPGTAFGATTPDEDLTVVVNTLKTESQDFTGGDSANYLRFIIQAFEVAF